MESDTKNKWTYAILILGLLVTCIGFALREAALLGLAALSYYCDQMAWAQDPFAESLEDVEDVTPEPSGEAIAT